MNKEQFVSDIEQGPIRPPSEADSLLLRLTRNCPWNKCTFCPVYKGTKFSIRPIEDVIDEINSLALCINILKEADRQYGGGSRRNHILATLKDDPLVDTPVFFTAYAWYFNGNMQSVFLQDANSLIMKPGEILQILRHLKKLFPESERITTYARSHTVNRISVENLKKFREAGLNRIHIGIESGCDRILSNVKKGADKEIHIRAGLKVIQAGIELSEYYMPGLGGKELWKENAAETAEVLNRINPDYIRLRTLAPVPGTPLYKDFATAKFNPPDDDTIAHEIILFLERLDITDCYLASDHILNLFGDLEGNLPEDKVNLIHIPERFLALPENEKLWYRVGRRMGILSRLDDLAIPNRIKRINKFCTENGIDAENCEAVLSALLERYL